jgi:hypothetical protein
MFDRIATAVLGVMIAASAGPAFAGTPVLGDAIVPTNGLPEPATMTLFAMGVGGAFLAKKLIGRR